MIATLIISLLCIVVFWLLSVRNRFFLYSLWCQFVLFWLRVCCGIRYEIEGLDNIPDYPVVALSTHQSTWETIYLYYVLSPVCPILKKELLSIPFWGWALRLQRPIAIDRSKPREAGKSLLVQGKARLEEGLSVVIFPEGTRSKAGTVKNFSKGGAMLAVHANTPALPVIHNAGGCWPARKMVKMPGVIKVRVGEPIAVEGKTAAQVTAEYAQWAEANMDIIKN
ncbi:MAG: lysophospholipid acyltransferase family protein [Pseudohongiellaceae bacterium]|nr:lysophospholipid acyltransferase family protein [Pseudohongiellaceae bacterium]